MHIPGHLAVGALIALEMRPWRGLPGRRWEAWTLAPVWLGALLPDLIDKPILWLGVSVYGRTVGHSVWVWALVCLVAAWARVRGARGAAALGWVAVGVGTHFVVDAVEGILIGGLHGKVWATSWCLWPHATPDTWSLVRSGPVPWPDGTRWVAFEALCVAAAVARVVIMASRRRRRRGAESDAKNEAEGAREGGSE